MDTNNRNLRRTASSWTTLCLLLLVVTTISTGICRASPVASPSEAAKVATTADKAEDEVVAVAVEVEMDEEDGDEPVVFATPAALVTTL